MKKYNKKKAQLEKKPRIIDHLNFKLTEKQTTSMVKNKWDIDFLFFNMCRIFSINFQDFFKVIFFYVKVEILSLGKNNDYLIERTESQPEPSSFRWHWSYSSGFGKESKRCDQIQDIFQYPVGDQKEVHLKEMR